MCAEEQGREMVSSRPFVSGGISEIPASPGLFVKYLFEGGLLAS